MRKDVKIGFAIGGVLLAVLVVYVLVISGGDKPEQVTLVTTDTQTPTDKAPAAEPPKVVEAPKAVEPKPAPETNTDPFKSSPTVAVTTAPAAEPDKATADDKWTGALQNGTLPVLMTSTPTTPEPAAPMVPVPAEANQPTPPVSTSVAPPIAASNAPASVAPEVPIRASSPTTREGAVAPDQVRTHVVQSGETFSSIAAAAYGSAAYYSHIMRANPTIDPRKIRPGMTINLPPVSEVRADSTASPAAAPVAQAVTPAPKLDAKTEYRVESGDSLYKISLKLYGKADRTEKIYELNKATIGPDQAKLKVGMVLKLPEAPTTAK